MTQAADTYAHNMAETRAHWTAQESRLYRANRAAETAAN